MEYFRSKRVLVAFIFFLFASSYFLIVQLFNPQCCDAVNYIELGSSISKNGILNANLTLRTYGYPLFISYIIEGADILNIPFIFVLHCIQMVIYLVVSRKLSKSIISTAEMGESNTVLSLLLCNIFVIPYFAISLADSLYVSLCLLSFAYFKITMNSTHLNQSVKSIFNKTFYSCLIVFSTISIRPVGVWLLGPLIFVLCNIIWRQKNYLVILTACILGMFPLYIQVVINVINHKTISFMPIVDLGSLQIAWGIENIKYSTWLGGGSAQNFYPSVGMINLSDSTRNLSWYFNNVFEGLHLLCLKLVGSFDFDFIMVYPYKKPIFTWGWSIFSSFLLIGGVFGTMYHLFLNRLRMLGNRFLPFVIFISWSVVNLISAIELRFTLPIISYFLVVCISLYNELLVWDIRRRLYFIIFLFLLLFCFFYLSTSIRMQSVLYN